jgi:hypothetical protein
MKNLILLAIRMARVMRKKMRQDRTMMSVNSQEMAKDPLSSVCQRSSRETHLRKAKHRIRLPKAPIKSFFDLY